MTDMSDQEKSVLLVKAMRWKIGEPHYHGAMTCASIMGSDGLAIGGHIHPLVRLADNSTRLDLYDPANMALAWRVHLWALSLGRPYNLARRVYTNWWKNEKPYESGGAQRLWLDKILELIMKIDNA